MHKNICNYMLSDNEGSLFTFSQSCNRDKKENPHSYHLQLHHRCVCTSVLCGNVLFDTVLCHNARDFILAPERFIQRVCQTCNFDSFWLHFTFERWVQRKLEAVLWIVLIQPHPLTSGILIKVVQYVQVKSSKEEFCISFDLSSSDANDIIVVVVVQVILIWT